MRILKKERGDCGGGKTIRYYLEKGQYDIRKNYARFRSKEGSNR
jgi:hypothetical protein